MTVTVCEQFYKKFNLQKSSKTENMKAKDPIWIFYITEDHDDGTKKNARCKYGAKCLFVFLSVLKVRD